MSAGTGKHTSARSREAWRKRWRTLLTPRWRELARDVLTDREAKVLGLRLGIVSDVGLTHAQIGRRLHCASNTIARIEKRAIATVTAALNLEGK
jgi:DNA-directed RNA polymerase sigma subunit (sigma70/sigma32)